MEFARMEPVEYGWSGDKKYHAWDQAGGEFFVRICPLEKEEHLHQALQLQQRAWDAGLPVCQPLGLERTPEGILTWETWCEGENLRQVIPHLSPEEQRRLGVEAGQALGGLHQLPGPEDAPPWEQVCRATMERKVRNYRNCPEQYEHGELLVAFVESHLDLLQGRPTRWLHGDYHDGNMLIHDGHLVVIDFDRCTQGDPWKEFSRLPWCAQASPLFAQSLLRGYFHGEPPEEFWMVLKLYIASNCLSSLPWAIPFGEQEIATMRNQTAEIFQWYDGMKNLIPNWYQPQ